jgi:hypothetical protein
VNTQKVNFGNDIEHFGKKAHEKSKIDFLRIHHHGLCQEVGKGAIGGFHRPPLKPNDDRGKSQRTMP